MGAAEKRLPALVDVVERTPENAVTTKPKRSPWILLLWPASLMLTVGVIWTTGYVYWQIRISGAIAELKRDGPARYENQLFYADPDLIEIGSRGVWRLLDEYEDAAARGDEDQAFAFSCGLGDALRGASEVSAEGAMSSGSYSRTRERRTLQEMRYEVKEFRDEISWYRGHYPGWWKWWTGRIGRRDPSW